MSRPIKFDNHPFRFLLYLEWILLAIAALTAILPYHPPRHAQIIPEIAIGSLVLFGVMGLRLPTGKYISRVIYTVLEVFLILLTGVYGGGTARLFPYLYVILVTRSCLIFKFSGRLAVTILSFLLFVFTLINRAPKFRMQAQEQERFLFFNLSIILLFGLSLVFVLLLMNTVLSERHSREELAIAHEKLRQYALKIENQATLEERNRIAREIHDSLGHSLTALNLQLETALKLSQSNPTKATSFLSRAKELASKALQDVRHSVSAMRSHPLQTQSLEQAINLLAEDFQRSTGIIPTCHIQIEYPLSIEINTAIYRIIQESLTNISKHASASEVYLELTTNNHGLELKIQDDGKGFDLMQNTTGFGLQSMRDRTLAVGGKLNINSAPGCGCQTTVIIPWPKLKI